MVTVSILAEDPYPAIALIVGGIISLFIAVYGKRDDSHLDELATYSGFILGAIMVVMAALVAIEATVNWFTLIVLILLAVTLFLKPLKDIPFAGIAGMIVGAAVALGLSLVLPESMFGAYRWVAFVVVFLVVGTIVHVLFHFIEDLMKIARMILDWRPVMALVGLLALVEGILVLLNSSLISLF